MSNLRHPDWPFFEDRHRALAHALDAWATQNISDDRLIRETLARHSGLADFAFAMQGLGSGAISLDGTAAQKERYLPRVVRAKCSN